MDNSIFNSVIRKIETTKDNNGEFLKMDSIIISHGSNVFEHYFTNDHGLHDLRSISKSIVGLALGIAIDNGLQLRSKVLNLETEIWPFFENKVNISNSKNIEKLRKFKLKHLLTHTCGYVDGLLYRKDIQDKDPFTFLEYVFNYDIVYKPGKHFVYSNVGPYLISAMIQEELGINFAEMVNEILFQKIGISDFEWENYGKYCAGASGLRLSNEDLHKMGLILIQNGKYKGAQIVSRNWVEKMRKPQVKTPSMYDKKRVFPKYAYGYYLWVCKDGRYFCDGNNGQYLIVLPKRGLVITLLGHQSDMVPITECLRDLL